MVRSKLKSFILYFLILIPFLVSYIGFKPNVFSGKQAFSYLQSIYKMGPCIPGTSKHEKVGAYIQDKLQNNGWLVITQQFEHDHIPLTNIIAKKGSGDSLIILGTHYDTRAVSDREREKGKQTEPVPGANDGDSGSAVLLELSRVLKLTENTEIWLVFFDGEDQGELNNWDWSIGAEYFVYQLQRSPSKVLIVDMIGDKDLNVYMEMNSTDSLNKEIWGIANKLGFQSYLLPKYKYAMIDDHIPFLNAGYATSLLIDFDYPYWHTTQDTMEHVSADSLQIIGDIITKWISVQNKENTVFDILIALIHSAFIKDKR